MASSYWRALVRATPCLNHGSAITSSSVRAFLLPPSPPAAADEAEAAAAALLLLLAAAALSLMVRCGGVVCGRRLGRVRTGSRSVGRLCVSCVMGGGAEGVE